MPCSGRLRQRFVMIVFKRLIENRGMEPIDSGALILGPMCVGPGKIKLKCNIYRPYCSP